MTSDWVVHWYTSRNVESWRWDIFPLSSLSLEKMDWCTGFFLYFSDSTKFEMIGTLMNWFHPCEMEICSWNLWMACWSPWSPLRKPRGQHGMLLWGIVKWVCFFVSFLWKAFSSLFSILLSIFAPEITHGCFLLLTIRWQMWKMGA